jgi:hypothetical protein
MIEYVNPALSRITLYDRHALIGSHVSMFRSGLMAPEILFDMWARVRGGQDWHGELLSQRKDGALYWEDVSLPPCAGRGRGHLPLRGGQGRHLQAQADGDSARGALLAAERLRQAVADVTIGLDDGETLAVSINLGVASIGEADTGIDDLLRRADAALYDANPPAASVCGNHRRRITRPSD